MPLDLSDSSLVTTILGTSVLIGFAMLMRVALFGRKCRNTTNPSWDEDDEED